MSGAPCWVFSLFLILTLSVNALTIETPNNVAACATTLISWAGGTGPYQLQVVPGTHVNVTTSMRVLQSAISGTFFQWNVDVRAGKNIALICQDATSTQVATNAFTISDTGCSSQQGQGNSPPSGQPGSQGSASSSQSQTSSSSQSTSTSSGSSHPSSISSFVSSLTQSSVSTVTSQTDRTAPSSSSDGLGAASSTTNASPTNNGSISSSTNSNHASVVGSVVGGICAFVAVLLVIFLLLYCRHRRRTRRTGMISINGSQSLPSSSLIIEPFLSPASPASLPSPWHGRPSKYGFQYASSPPPPPSPSNSSSSRTNVLTTGQVNLVQQLCDLHVPAAAVTQVIDRMLLHPGDASSPPAEINRITPPAYDFKQ